MEKEEPFINQSLFYSRSGGKGLRNNEMYQDPLHDITNEDYTKEYKYQNDQLSKLVKQRLIFLQELQEEERLIIKKRDEIQSNCNLGRSRIGVVDQDIQNLMRECKQISEQTTNKQDRLLQDKTNLHKREVEQLSLLNHEKQQLQKRVDKSENEKRIYSALQQEYTFYKQNLDNVNENYQQLLQQINTYSSATHLDAQLSSFTQQKQNLNEKLQSQKGNIRVYCRIRPLTLEEKISMLQNSFKRIYEEKQNLQNNSATNQSNSTNHANSTNHTNSTNHANSTNLSNSNNPRMIGKASVQKSSNGKNIELVKGISSVSKDENTQTYQQEMQQYVQGILDIVKDDDNLLYSMIPNNRIIRTQNAQNLKLSVPFQNVKSENNIKEYAFKLEHVFEEDATQMEVFSNLQELIQSVLDGYNVCIFAYGPTGSGKTYTMQGEEDYDKWGIIPRSIEYIYQEIEKMQHYGWDHKIKIQFSEIYNETLIDLIHPDGKKDEVQDKEINNGPQEIMKILQKGYVSRKVASTDCNEYSSRSHSIFRMNIDGYNTIKQGKNPTQPLLKGSLNLVDLAGSERINQSNVAGDRLKETQNINKSLTSLAAVITSLAKKEVFTSFRNSKLTYYLHEYLGGKSKTLMMVNISPSPSSFYPTLTTLRFADQAKQCQNKTEPNTVGSSLTNQTFGQRSTTPTNSVTSVGKQSQQKTTNSSTPNKSGRFQNTLAQSNIRNTILNSSKK